IAQGTRSPRTSSRGRVGETVAVTAGEGRPVAAGGGGGGGAPSPEPEEHPASTIAPAPSAMALRMSMGMKALLRHPALRIQGPPGSPANPTIWAMTRL